MHHFLLLVVGAFLLLPAGSPAGAEEGGGGWITVAPASETYEVEMPIEPKKEVKKTSTFVGTVEDVSYRARDGDEVFLATSVKLPGMATFFMSDSFLLDSIRDSFLEKGNGTEKSYVDVKREGHDGKRLDFVMNDSDGKEDARAEFFLVDGKMLSFTGIVPQGHSMEEVDRFLASIQLERD